MYHQSYITKYTSIRRATPLEQDSGGVSNRGGVPKGELRGGPPSQTFSLKYSYAPSELGTYKKVKARFFPLPSEEDYFNGVRT